MERGGGGGEGRVGIMSALLTVGHRFVSLMCTVTSYHREIRTSTFLYLNIFKVFICVFNFPGL